MQMFSFLLWRYASKLKELFNLFCLFYVSESSEISLQLLETLIKNCGDHVHFQVVERNILEEMMKIVKKKVTFLNFLITILGF